MKYETLENLYNLARKYNVQELRNEIVEIILDDFYTAEKPDLLYMYTSMFISGDFNHVLVDDALVEVNPKNLYSILTNRPEQIE